MLTMLITLEKWINRIVDFAGAVAATLLILLVLLISWNIFSRYLFAASSIGLEELSWHFYASIFLLGLSYALKTGSHVRVDLIFENLTVKTRAVIDLVGSIIFLLPFCIIVIWSGWQFTYEAWSLGSRPDEFTELFKQLVQTGVGEKSQDPGGLLNRWFIKGMIPFSFFMLFLASIAFVIHKINVLAGIERDNEQDHVHRELS